MKVERWIQQNRHIGRYMFGFAIATPAAVSSDMTFWGWVGVCVVMFIGADWGWE